VCVGGVAHEDGRVRSAPMPRELRPHFGGSVRVQKSFCCTPVHKRTLPHVDHVCQRARRCIKSDSKDTGEIHRRAKEPTRDEECSEKERPKRRPNVRRHSFMMFWTLPLSSSPEWGLWTPPAVQSLSRIYQICVCVCVCVCRGGGGGGRQAAVCTHA
jgi:hypothetical protein